MKTLYFFTSERIIEQNIYSKKPPQA